MKKNNKEVRTTNHSEDVECGGKAATNTSTSTITCPENNGNPAVKLRTSKKKLFRRIAIMSSVITLLVAICALVYYYMGCMALVQLILVALVAYIVAGKKYRWFIIALRTLPRDAIALLRYIKLIIQIRGYSKKDASLADIFRQHVAKDPNKICFIFEDKEWTFAEVEEYSNKVANIFKSHGYRKGDVVALFLENRPEFVCIWLGLSKIGVIVPLINTNQKLNSLFHSITIAKSQAVIFSTDLAPAIGEILDKIESTVALYQLSNDSDNGNYGDNADTLKCQNLNKLVNDAAPTPPNLSDKINIHDHLMYIYTSGTTGLPKAAVISHYKFIFIVAAIHSLAGFKKNDRFYTALPLYHTAGGCMTIGQMLLYGNTVVIRKKFSASAYFSDCKKYECTVGQYIGEMCRYVMAVPSKPEDKDHKLRMVFGNGLRPQIWQEFKERFNISKIKEFYGATEGNANIMNVDDTVGAVGFISRIIPSIYPISIIRVDPVSGDPIRNSKGLCMVCKPGEPGVFIGKIIPNDPSREFLGYVDKQASQKKVVCDVFHKGDSAFISGDILVADELGYLYFKDRTGDTYRWKGENVSTSEVEAIISNIVSYKDVIVYGVQISGQEGRAGMAAILDADESLDLNEFATNVKKALPTYARPIFIRLLHKLDMTGTFKLKKTDLQKDSFDPTMTTDNIFYLNSSGTYTLITKEIYEQINNGKIRL